MGRHVVHSRGHWQLGTALALAACIGQACSGSVKSNDIPTGVILATDSSLPNPYGAPLGDGKHDDTFSLQWCIDFAFSAGMVLGIPTGDYLVSDTLNVTQAFWGDSIKDGGINIVRSRWRANIIMGVPANLTSGTWQRPRITLAAGCGGFQDAAVLRPVIHVTMPHCYGENDNMNQAVRSINIVISDGNDGAVGLYFHGAQGSLISDVRVEAGDGFAGFFGAVGAGSSFINVAVVGGRYGLYAPDGTSEPSSVIAAANFSNQSTSAIYWVGQANLVLTGVHIVVSRPTALAAITRGPKHGQMIMLDGVVECYEAGAALDAGASLFLHNTHVHGCSRLLLEAGKDLRPSPTGWHYVQDFSYSVNNTKWGTTFNMDVAYLNNMQTIRQGWAVEHVWPSSAPDLTSLQSKHGLPIDEFPSFWTCQDAVYRCGAVGDGHQDDTEALQLCLNTYACVFLPKGRYRLSSSLVMQGRSSLIGLSQTHSVLIAASEGLSGSGAQPLLRTSTEYTVVAFIGLVTWWHLSTVFTMDWRASDGIYLSNYESRYGECLWLMSYFSVSSNPQCATPTNLTLAKTVIRGGGRFYNLVSDEDIAFTSPSYRHILVVHDEPAAKRELKFYGLNVEHSLSEANFEVRSGENLSIDIYALKGEGSLPLLWVRDADDFNLWGLGGGADALPLSNGSLYLPASFSSEQKRYAPAGLRIERTSSYRLVSLANPGRSSAGSPIHDIKESPIPDAVARTFPWPADIREAIISSVWQGWPGLAVPPQLYAEVAVCDGPDMCTTTEALHRPILVAAGHPEYDSTSFVTHQSAQLTIVA